MIEGVELIIRQPGHPDRVVRVRKGETRLGRAEDNDIVLSDVGVSRRHARIMLRDDELRYTDLGSGNGSYYRGRRVDEQNLSDHDEIMIDPFVLTFRVRGAGQPSIEEQTLDGSPARLDVISAPGIFRSYFPLDRAGLSIGRADNQDVVLPDPASSRQHCRIQPRGTGFALVDQGSANGVFLNGRRTTDAMLRHGDRIRIGNSEFRFASGDAPMGFAEPSRDHLALPPQESPTPLAARVRQRPSPLPKIILAATSTLVLLAVILALVLLLVVQLQRRQQVASVTAPSGPPHWVVQGAVAVGSPDQIFEQGRTAIENSRSDEAFASFTQVLQARPGDPSAERFALLAAEFEILDTLQPRFEAKALERETAEAKRDALFELTLTRTAKARRAVQVIREEYRDDPAAQAHMGWTPTEEQEALAAQVDEANALVVQGDAYGALELFQKVAEQAVHDETRAAAHAGAEQARKQLAAKVATRWSRGVIAQHSGNADEARQQFRELLALYPSNPSVAVRTGSAP